MIVTRIMFKIKHNPLKSNQNRHCEACKAGCGNPVLKALPLLGVGLGGGFIGNTSFS